MNVTSGRLLPYCPLWYYNCASVNISWKFDTLKKSNILFMCVLLKKKKSNILFICPTSLILFSIKALNGLEFWRDAPFQ